MGLVSPASTAIRVPVAALRAQQVVGAVQSMRPGDTAVVIVATLISARLAQPVGLGPMDVALVAIANGFLCAASMAFNDWHDVREDAINEPTRPIVAGRIGRSAVLQLASTLSLLGVVIAWTAPGWRFGAVAVGVVGASVAYSMRLKSIPLVGNITTAIVHSFPFWCWLLWEVEPLGLYPPLCLVVLADRFGAEIIKTSEDVRGDRMSDIDTVATRWGPVRAMALGCASLVLAAVAAWWPVVAGGADPVYVLWTVGVTLLLAITCALPIVRALPVEVVARDVVRLHRIGIGIAVVGLLLV